jgi:hypothetical protein
MKLATCKGGLVVHGFLLVGLDFNACQGEAIFKHLSRFNSLINRPVIARHCLCGLVFVVYDECVFFHTGTS